MARADELILAHYCLAAATLDERCTAATAGGFAAIGLTTAAYEAARDAYGGDGAVAHRLDESGVRIAEVTSMPVGGPDTADALAAATALRVHLAEVFGVECFSVSIERGHDAGYQRDAFAGVCERFADAGARAGIEFTPVIRALEDLPSTVAFLRRSGAHNAGVVVDSYHFFRGGGTIDQLAAAAPADVVAVQISDASVPPVSDDYVTDTMHHRRLPGDGDLDLVGFVRAIDELGVGVPWSVEVLSTELGVLDAAALGELLGDTTRALLARARNR